MIYGVYVRPEAENDILEAALWYEEQKKGLGNDYLNEINRAIKAISETPLIYPSLYKNIRRILMSRFPFGVFYKVEKDRIVVIAVMHGSRNPSKWHNRL